MTCVKSINGLSNGKWALIQIQATRPKKLFLVEKLRKFLILRFYNSIVLQTPYNALDARLTFEGHLKIITTKVNKTMGLLRKLQKKLPIPVLMTIWTCFFLTAANFWFFFFFKMKIWDNSLNFYCFWKKH